MYQVGLVFRCCWVITIGDDQSSDGLEPGAEEWTMFCQAKLDILIHDEFFLHGVAILKRDDLG